MPGRPKILSGRPWNLKVRLPPPAIILAMSVVSRQESPASPSSLLGPYCRGDYEALPDEPRCELIYGSLFVSPSPSLLHQLVSGILYERLRACAKGNGSRVIFAPLDVCLSEHSVVQPDLLYISRRRRDIVGERIEGAPDLLVEILSPGTARRDRGEKLRLYAESGVREYWIVDPTEQQIEFLHNEAGRFVVVLPMDGRYASQALPEVRLDLEALWRQLGEELAP